MPGERRPRRSTDRSLGQATGRFVLWRRAGAECQVEDPWRPLPHGRPAPQIAGWLIDCRSGSSPGVRCELSREPPRVSVRAIAGSDRGVFVEWHVDACECRRFGERASAGSFWPRLLQAAGTAARASVAGRCRRLKKRLPAARAREFSTWPRKWPQLERQSNVLKKVVKLVEPDRRPHRGRKERCSAASTRARLKRPAPASSSTLAEQHLRASPTGT